VQNFIQIGWDLVVRGPKTCFWLKTRAWPSLCLGLAVNYPALIIFGIWHHKDTRYWKTYPSHLKLLPHYPTKCKKWNFKQHLRVILIKQLVSVSQYLQNSCKFNNFQDSHNIHVLKQWETSSISLYYSQCSKYTDRTMESVYTTSSSSSSTMHCWNAVHLWNWCNSGRMTSLWTLTVMP